MKRNQLAIAAVLALAAGATFAAAPVSDTTREQRMDQALQNYRSQQNHGRPAAQTTAQSAAQSSEQPGVIARAESSVKRGAHKTAQAFKRGAHKTGAAIGKGVRKTGDALHNAGEKMESKASN